MLFLHKISQFFLNLICPPCCPICNADTDAPACLCPDCFSRIRFITKPCCAICGQPFEYSPFKEIICGSCMRKKPKYKIARSILVYDDFSKQLVLAFKHGDRTDLVPLFTKMLLQTDPIVFHDVDLIISVPLHRFRLLKRKYNQSSLLGKALGQKINIPFCPLMLKRIKRTPSSGHRSKKTRERNIQNAIQVTNPQKLKGKTVLLIDDVMTTGATVNECCKVLLKAGVKDVHVLTLYRVLL